jgi:anaerobic magnesium-protoporphyrin IX monomethyl ester cyclase
MRLTLISPRLAMQKGDFLGSGVPYWPLELATLAAYARKMGDVIRIIDQFGENPSLLSDAGDHYLQGVPIDSSSWYGDLEDADAFVLYAISYMSHKELLSTTQWLKQSYPTKPVAVLENSQAVTAYSISHMAQSFLDAGADFLICGEPYSNWQLIKRCFNLSPSDLMLVDNIISPGSESFQVRRAEKIDRYPTPAWDLINMESYWRLPYSHGPKTEKFLPILTSRGCPYPCDFCVVPETNNKRWQGNDPEDVVREIIELRDKYGVQHFQVEDLNPTVQHYRWERICELLIEKNANIHFYFVSGTKAETLRLDKIPLFAKAGCRYISISPESGSGDLKRVIGKKFNQNHGLELIKECRKYKIRTQACFLVGHPQEEEKDFLATKKYLVELVGAGLDEVAVFVVAPFAGSKLFTQNKISLESISALTSFSPKGRSNYKILEARRKYLISIFFIKKLWKGGDLWMQGWRSIFGIPETKMENLPRRIIYVALLLLKRKFMSLRRDHNA